MAEASLLSYLDPDPELALRKLESIRRRLITFFECSRLRDSEDLAHDVIIRAQQSLAKGKEIYAHEPWYYFLGIARNVRFRGSGFRGQAT